MQNPNSIAIRGSVFFRCSNIGPIICWNSCSATSGMVSLQLNKGEEIFTVYHDDYLSPDDVKQLVNDWGNCDVQSLSIVLIDGLD